MKDRTIEVWEIFEVEPELAYDVCFQGVAVPPDPQELIDRGAPPEVVRAARALQERHFVRIADRPRRFVAEQFDGLVTSRLEMELAPDLWGTWVTLRFSLHPHGFLGRILTAIPRLRLGRNQGSMREQLRGLKSRCEERAFLIDAHSPPEESRQRRLRQRGESLLAGSAYFEVLLGGGEVPPEVAFLRGTLHELARFHLALAGTSPEDAELRRIVESKIHTSFERRLATGDAEALAHFVGWHPYYIAWALRLASISKDGLMALDGIARGDREVMGKMFLESLGPPEAEELERMREEMDLKPEVLLLPFAKWYRGRQGAQMPPVRRKSGPPLPARGRRTPPQRFAEAERHYTRGRALSKEARPGDRDQMEEALAAFAAAGALLTPADGSVWGLVRINWASALMAQNRPGRRAEDVEAALAACNEALAVFTRDRNALQHGLAKIERGQLMRSRLVGPMRSNLEGAVADFREAAEALDPARHPLPWAEALLYLADSLVRRPGYDRSANLEEAIATAERALTVLDRDRTWEEWVHAKVTLGAAFAARSEGDPEKNLEASIEHLEEALAACDSLVHPIIRGAVLHDLAASYLDRIAGPPLDNADRAIALLEEALALVPADFDPRLADHWWMALGNAYMGRRRGARQDNYERALEAFRRAGESIRREDEPQLWAILQENIGHAYLKAPEGDSEETLRGAIAAFESALETLTPLDDPRSWVLTQGGLGDAYTRFPKGQTPGPEIFVGRLEKAIAAYDAGLTLAQPETDPWKWAGLHSNRALAHEMLRLAAELVGAGSLPATIDEEARASLEKALEVFTCDRAPRQHVSASLSLGMVHLRRRDWPAAEAAFGSALRASDLLVGGIDAHDSEARETLRSLGRLAANLPVPSLRRGDPKRALALWEASRARLLAKSLHLETIGLSKPERRELEEAVDEENRIEDRLGTGDRVEGRLALLERQAELRRRKREIVAPHYRPATLGPDEVESLVAAGTRDGSVLVAPILTEAGSWIVVGLRAKGGSEIRSVELEGESHKLLKEILRLWLAPDGLGLAEIGPRLWQLFAGRLVAQLEAAGIPRGARLVLFPQGGLGLVPLGLAREPATGEELSDRYEIGYAPSLTALVRARERAAEAGARPARAAVIEADSRGNLVGSKPEARLVQSWFAGASPPPPLAEVPTPEQALALLAGQDLWHFATHGTFKPDDPTRSGLELTAVRRLTVADLLGAKGLGHPRLAVLSACSTGVYDNRHAPLEFTGLTAAFLQAGAAGVIASLRPVDDVATTLLVGRFYDLFLGQGLRPGAALQGAQGWLRSASLVELQEKLRSWQAQGRISQDAVEALSGAVEEAARETDDPAVYADPVFWSAFVHYGA